MAERGTPQGSTPFDQQLELDALPADSARRRRAVMPDGLGRRHHRDTERGPGGSARTPVVRKPPLPRLSVSPGEAAEMLGISRDFFDEHIKPELRVVRRGSKLILIPVAELERWLEKSAARWA
jgi:excisionase family DNA binding protein